MLNQDTPTDIAPKTSVAHLSLDDHNYCSTAKIIPIPVAPANVVEDEPLKRKRIISRDSDHLYEEDLSSDYSSSEGEQDDDDSDEDDNEDDPNRLWCVCQKPYDNKFMICCDVCKYWFHGNCVGITKMMGERFEREKKEWFCQECLDKMKSGVPRNAIPLKIVKKEKKKKKFRSATGKRGRGRPRKSDIASREIGTRSSSRNPRKSLDAKLGIDNGRLTRRGNSRPEARIETFDEFEDSQRLKVLIKERKKEFFYKRQLAEQQKAVKRNELGLGRRSITAELGDSLDSLACSTNTPNMNNLPINIKSEHTKERHKPPIVIQINTKKEPGSEHGTPKIITTIIKPPKKMNSPELSNSSLNDLFTAEPITISKKYKTQNDGQSSRSGSDSNIIDKKINSTTSASSNNNKRSVSGELSPGQIMQKKKRKDSESSTPNGSTHHDTEIIFQKIKEALVLRNKDMKDIEQVSTEKIETLASEIENKLNECFTDASLKLRRFRSMIFNLKDLKNKYLVRNVLIGDIPPSRLVRMSPEEMASNEKKEWRERENKHSIDLITRDAQMAAQQVIVKKTHKGEEVISAPSLDDSTAEVASQEPPITPTKSPKEKYKTKVEELTNKASSPTININPQMNPSGNIDTNVKLSPSEKKTNVESINVVNDDVATKTQITLSDEKEIDPEQPYPHEPKRFSVTIQSSLNPADLSRLKEPLVKPVERKSDEQNDYNSMTPKEEDQTSPMNQDEEDDDDDEDDVDDLEYDPEAAPPGLDDIDQSKFDIDTAPPSLEVTNKLTNNCETMKDFNVVWSGKITMPDVAKFKSTAKIVDGDATFMSSEVSHDLTVCGRIAPDQMQGYIKRLRTTTKNQILILQLFPQDSEDKTSFNTFFDYLYSRNRCGVVQTNPQILKDFYILPLHERSGIPEVLKPLKNSSLDRRNNPNSLIGLLVRSKR